MENKEPKQKEVFKKEIQISEDVLVIVGLFILFVVLVLITYGLRWLAGAL